VARSRSLVSLARRREWNVVYMSLVRRLYRFVPASGLDDVASKKNEPEEGGISSYPSERWRWAKEGYRAVVDSCRSALPMCLSRAIPNIVLILNPTLISWANLRETLLLSLLVIVFSDLTILGLKFERLFIFYIRNHLLQ